MDNFLNNNDAYVTSDLHLGHKLVSGLRGFDSTDEHDDKIIEGLNNLPDGSLIMCLGDISVRKDSYALEILGGLKKSKGFKFWLAPGNHDKVHPISKGDTILWDKPYREVFDMIQMGYFTLMNKKKIYFTHYPELRSDAVSIDKENQRNHCWFTAPGFDVVVHGHTHSNIVTSWNDHHINVALEAHDMKPVPMRNIREMISNI